MKRISILLALTMFFQLSCQKEIFIEDIEILPTLTSPSHGAGFDPDYDVVFEQKKVHRLDLVISSSDWSDMQSNLSTVTRNSRPGDFSEVTPSYFPCDLYYDDLLWEDVGVRYKGNSSLNANSGKLPLRFDFDEFEDDNPAILDQRFYGFKELSMSSNYNDPSLVREKTADDLFRSFGVPAVNTAFYEIYIDNGSGPQYYGLYTMCEVVFDAFLESYFGSNTGNCYKPDGDGATFGQSQFNLNDFELKTNEDLNDKDDVTEMFQLLHAGTRTSAPVQWRQDLEAVFDVDGFLKYLAVNNTIQNWDTYGNMTHNYYLYHDPADDLIKWIAWDNNEAFQDGNRTGSVSFSMDEVNDTWPLISYIREDEFYFEAYKTHVEDFITNHFDQASMTSIYDSHQALLSESADNERSGYSYVNGRFDAGITAMKNHNTSRIAAANSFLR